MADNRKSYSLRMSKHKKGRGQGHVSDVTHFLIFEAIVISLERMKLEWSSFVHVLGSIKF